MSPGNRSPYEPSRRTRQFDRAITLLLERINLLSGSQSPVLPAISQLSRDAGVSRQVMVRALRYYRERHVVQAIGNRGYIVVAGARDLSLRDSAPESQPQGDTLRGRAALVRDQMVHDIAIRKYPPGAALPQAKELAHRYGTCRAIVSKVIFELQSNGMVESVKRRVRVCMPAKAQSHAVVVFVLHHTISLDPTGASPHAAEFWHAVEQQCHTRNLKVVLCTERDAKSVIEKTGACGAVLLTSQFSEADLRLIYNDMQLQGRPLAIFDDVGSAPSELHPKAGAHILVVQCALGCAAGREMGVHLSGLGHRKIALFSLSPDSPHTRDRLAGLRQALHERMLADAVTMYAPDRPLIDPFADERLLRDALYRQVRRFVKHKGGEDMNPLIRQNLWHIVEWERNKLALWPLFEQARSNAMTAWVGVSDAIAVQALLFLRHNEMVVPQDISLAGFDNTPATFSHGITSYSFNAPGAVARLLDHIVQPGSNRQGLFTVRQTPGYLVERTTTGPVCHVFG